MAFGGVDNIDEKVSFNTSQSEELDIAALRQAVIENNNFVKECQRTIGTLSAEIASFRREIGNLKSENRALKQVNRLVWYLARKMSRSQYDRLCLQLETDEEFRNQLSSLMQDHSLQNIKDITQEFLRLHPQFKGSEKCCVLRYLGACCCCCQPE